MMATHMVLAHGDNGREMIPAAEAVTPTVVPLGPGNLVVPATVRWSNESKGGGIPTRIRELTATARGVYVTYDCTPFPRYSKPNGSFVYGEWSGCTVRNRADAADSLWSQLSRSDQARILAALEAQA